MANKTAMKTGDPGTELSQAQRSPEVEQYYRKLTSMYREDKKKLRQECKYIRVAYTNQYDLSTLRALIDKHKGGSKTFRLLSIDNVEDDTFKYSTSISVAEGKKGEVITNDETGVFKMNFSDGSFMYFSKWMSGEGKGRMVDSIFLAEDSVWKNLINLINKEKRKKSKPPVGKVYKFDGTYVTRKLKETPVVHESVKNVKEDIDMFFSNLDKFTRFNMPGTRKVMLVGPPGTGKSSLAIRIAKQYMKEKNVTFFTDIGMLASHMAACAKYSVSTICILEDAEGSLQRPDSGLLNLLDGIDQPVNTKGSYVIMTTNYPQKIEPRILQRPGRVDQIFAFGNLTGEYVIKCAEIYLADTFFGKDKIVEGTEQEIRDGLIKIFDADGKGVAGTRIKQFSEDVLKYMISKKKDTVTLKEAEDVFNQTTENLKSVYEMAQEQGLLEGDSVGFSWGEKNAKSNLQFDERDFA